MNVPLLQAKGLVKHFPVSSTSFGRKSRQLVKAVNGIDFEVGEGESFGLIGESGCGKTTTVKMLLGLEMPTAGSIFFEGNEVRIDDTRAMRSYRAGVQAVFQDPYSALNPRMRVREIVGEPLIAAGGYTRRDIADRVNELIELVGLPSDAAVRFPHEFSGGQRQRIAIARGLAVQPRLLVLDEPVSALDLSIRAQVLNLLRQLQDKFGLSYLFISHDLDIVAHMCRRIAVMYLGCIVENGSAEQIRHAPVHPYTQALVSAVLPADPRRLRQRVRLRGPIPSPLNVPSGCGFHTRCPLAQPTCGESQPLLREVGVGRSIACHFPAALASPGPVGG